MAPVVERLYRVFGERAVLLPLRAGTKVPVAADWTSISWEDTQEPGYRAALEQGGVGVMCGCCVAADAGGVAWLCAIDIDTDEAVGEFFELNPGLRDTVISRGHRGVKVWVRCLTDASLEKRGLPSFPVGKQGIFLRDTKTGEKCKAENGAGVKWGDWLAEGSHGVVCGVHPDTGRPYSFVRVGDGGAMEELSLDAAEFPQVREVYFREIRWPVEVFQKWRDDDWEALTNVYGRPWDFVVTEGRSDGDPGVVAIGALSEHFWAGWVAMNFHILYEAEEVDFFLYNSRTGGWEIRTEDEVRALISHALLELSRSVEFRRVCYKAPPPGWLALSPGSLAEMEGPKVRASDRIGRIISFLRGEVAMRKVFRAGTGIIHLKNGMLDLRARKPVLAGFSPRYYSRNPIPVCFEGSGRRARKFTEFLKSALPDDDIDLLQRIGGLILLGRNDSQVMSILSGTAGGGKSTCVKIIQLLIGRPNVVELRTGQLNERFEMSAFLRRTLLCGVDVPGDFLMRPGADRIKALTGGDWMTAEIKGGKHFIDITGEFNVIVTCNSRLRVRLHADVEAWRRRLRIIRFEQPPVPREKRVDKFAEFLIEHEGPGILNFFIKGAFAVLAGDKIKCNPRQQKVVDDMLDESDSVRVFLREEVRQCVKGEHGYILSQELVEAYFRYCENAGWDAESKRTAEKQFTEMMLSMFRAKQSNSLKDEEGKSKVGYRGVTWKDTPVPAVEGVKEAAVF